MLNNTLAVCRTDKIETFGEAIPILEFAAAETKKRAPHLTHPHLCLEAIKYGIEHGGLAGLRKVCSAMLHSSRFSWPKIADEENLII